MLNRVILMGRITHDLELRQTPSGVCTLSFSVAVERNYTNQNGERQTDFVTCVAWRQQAEFIGKYFSKGRMIALEGSLRSRTYDDKNGSKHYVTEVYVDAASFTGEPKKSSQGGGQPQNNEYVQDDNRNVPEVYTDGHHMSLSKPKDPESQIDLSDFEEIISDDGVPF